MNRSTRFRLTRWAVLLFVVSVGGAMFAYAGGTQSDRSFRGYSLLGSPLSALGRTVAWNGQANLPSEVLFTIGVTAAGGALVLFFVTLLPLYTVPGAGQWLARVGCLFGIAAGLCYVGVAWAPVNLHPRLHAQFSQTAFRAFLAASLLLGAATARHAAFSRRSAAGWLSFAVLLAAFIVIGIVARGGPVPVVAQKIVVLSSLLIVIFQSYEAERAAGGLIRA